MTHDEIQEDTRDPFEDLDPGPEDQILEQAWTALDDGDAERAITQLEQLDADWPERWVPEAIARTELGPLRRARQVLDQARAFEGLQGEPDFLWAEGRLCLCEWKVEDAKRSLEALERLESSAPVLERLSLCAELEGDFERADQLLVRAGKLDPNMQVVERVSQSEFAAVVDRALGELPPAFRGPLETIEIVVEAVPSPWMVDLSDPSETPPDILGLFVGPSELERAEFDSGQLPARIFLFQRNLERASKDRDELVAEIRTTLFHEIAHLLGFDEHGVAGMGLE